MPVRSAIVALLMAEKTGRRAGKLKLDMDTGLMNERIPISFKMTFAHS